MINVIDRNELYEFICLESELIDDRRFPEWLDLFTEDSIYWVPAMHDQENPQTHVSLFYDDYHTLKIRITRLMHPQIHCQQPSSRTVHLMSGTRVVEENPDAGTVKTRSNFIIMEDRPSADKRMYGGVCWHELRRSGTSFKIAKKTVVLTDCDKFFPALTVPF